MIKPAEEPGIDMITTNKPYQSRGSYSNVSIFLAYSNVIKCLFNFSKHLFLRLVVFLIKISQSDMKFGSSG